MTKLLDHWGGDGSLHTSTDAQNDTATNQHTDAGRKGVD